MRIIGINLNTACQNNRYRNPKGFKNNIICFKSKNLSTMSPQELLDEVRLSIKPENFIGHGTEAEVFRIKDSDYCVRVPYEMLSTKNFKYSKELTPFDKINHVVARLGYGISLLKYFDGDTPKMYINNNHERYKFQEKISNMPLKSYSNLLHQIANAINHGFLFDFSPGNLIVNTEKNTLTAIDFVCIVENPRTIRPLYEMYSVLTCYGSLEKTGKKIFDNIVDTGLEEFKPNKKPCMDIEKFDFLELVMLRNKDIRLKASDINSESYDFAKLSTKICQTVQSLKNIKKEELNNKICGNTLLEEIKKLKNLLSKIR